MMTVVDCHSCLIGERENQDRIPSCISPPCPPSDSTAGLDIDNRCRAGNGSAVCEVSPLISYHGEVSH